MGYNKKFFNLVDIFNIMLVETAPNEDGVDLHWYDVYSILEYNYNCLRSKDKEEFDCIVNEIKKDGPLIDLYTQYREFIVKKNKPGNDEYDIDCYEQDIDFVENEIYGILSKSFNNFVNY